MRLFKTSLLALAALACAGAQAATYEFSLTNPSLTLLDLTPDDQLMPSYTVDNGSVLDLLTPSYYGDKGMFFETNTILPPNTGPYAAHITGTLGSGSQLIWKATGHLKISAIDVDASGWDWDGVRVQTSFYSTDVGQDSTSFEVNVPSPGGNGGTYQRFTQEYDLNIEIHATNRTERSRYFQLGWFNQFQLDSGITPRPITAIPEPETYALLLAGLGIIGAVARRRKAIQA